MDYNNNKIEIYFSIFIYKNVAYIKY